MPGTRRARNDEELKSAASRVAYEMETLLIARDAILLAQQGHSAFERCALESFLIHIRCLRDCFYAEKPCDDDVIACDFLPCWESHRPLIPQVIDQRKQALDKLLAHLSYQRETLLGTYGDWPFDEMAQAMLTVIKAFLDKLPPERAAWFRR